MPTLGIDPGTALTGYGLIKKEEDKLRVIDYGCIKTKVSAEGKGHLKELYTGVKNLIQKYNPRFLAIEKLFFSANVKTAMAVGQAKGIAILAAAEMNLRIVEYTPLEVKQAVTGYGKAEKLQVQKMVQAILRLRSIPKPDDVADALAVAICHLHSYALSKKIKEFMK